MRAGAGDAARLAIHGVLALHDVPATVPEVADAREVGAEVARGRTDDSTTAEVVAPRIIWCAAEVLNRHWCRGGLRCDRRWQGRAWLHSDWGWRYGRGHVNGSEREHRVQLHPTM